MDSKAKLAACLNILGINPKLETFDERKLLQKLVYLVQQFGVDLGFSYNWYLHGPYSPDLTRTLYDMAKSGIYSHCELSESETSRIKNLISFLGEDIRSSDRLELIVSIIYLRNERGASDEEVFNTIKRTKPYFSDKEVHNCLNRSTELEKVTRLSKRI